MEPTHDTKIEFESLPDYMPGIRKYRSHPDGQLLVLVGREPVQSGDVKWHLSISHPSRLPTWDEVAQAREKFVPDRVTMAMILPPRSQYVNLHNNCLQIWEVDLR